MLIEAATVPADTTIEADVCIVGAGPAGITLARELERSGQRICLLESGGFAAEPRVQALNRGEIAGDWAQPLEQMRQRRVGGTAHGWAERIGFRRPGGRFVPLTPVDFERREGVPNSGWPFGFEELRPYYVRAQRLCQLGPFAYDGAHWQTARAPLLPLANELVQTRVFQIGRRSVFTDSHAAALARSRRVSLYLHATALALQTNGCGAAVTRVCVAAPGGRRFAVAARLFVLAQGAIENARLLLLSNGDRPAGPGNEHDLVGRFLMEHPQVYTGMLVPFAAQTWRHAGLYDVQTVAGVPVMGHLALDDAALRRDARTAAGMMLFPRPRPAEIAAADRAWSILRRPARLRGAARAMLGDLVPGRHYLWPLLLRTFT
ncbi:MAG TPA: FAD-dependent monooxygenase, partial [Dehalococcoidia bacterium]|nr:FAD-dependent monooxygenase [Dehalococcoidia bacterium]